MALPILEPGEPLPGGDPGTGTGGGAGNGGGGSSAVVGSVIESGSFTLTSAGSLLVVTIFASVEAVDDLRGLAYLVVNGRVEQIQPFNFIFDTRPSAASGPLTLAFAIDGLPAGPVQLAFAVRNRDPSGNLTVRKRCFIRIEEIKSPAR